jgi:hypothetical protein
MVKKLPPMDWRIIMHNGTTKSALSSVMCYMLGKPDLRLNINFSALLRLAALLMGMIAFMGEAHADRTINWVTLDGGASVTVAPGTTISASINVTHDGGGSNNNWYSTGWRISTTPPGSITCVDTPNHGNNGIDTETFDITAPATPGTYNAYFIAYRSDDTDCDAGSSTTYTLSNAVIVVAPTTVINTYYPATASATAGSTSLALGPATGIGTPIASGDLLLVMQMQDAAINANNSDAYGNGVSGDGIGTGAAAVNGSGVYEYVVAANAVPLGGGTLSLPCGITNSYSHANATTTSGQKRFQVIRVPVYASYTLVNTVTAQAWNGSTGGVLAFDVTGTLNLNSASISVDGLGFRGGAAYTMGGSSGLSYTDYRTQATDNGNGGKGEGIAGTPRYVFTTPGTLTNNGAEGYPNGSRARGAPANGGGGATDRNPSSNDQNSGGGGGGNGGNGGIGGIGWCSGFNTTPPYYGCGYSALVSAVNPNGSTGGFGGAAVPGLGAGRLTLGGGGGAATANNVTGSGACAAVDGLCSSGAAGGGIIMIRAADLNGSATFNANGSDGDSTIGNDGSGGGGGGGTVLISAGSGMGGVTINVQGGAGGSNLVGGSSHTPHGPGGGGGGGFAITEGASAGCNTSGGANGVTYNGTSYFGAYGAQPGSGGSCLTSLTSAQIPGAGLGGASACPSGLDNFSIDVGGGTASTCAPRSVSITARDSADVTLTSYVGSITVSTSSGHGDWAVNTANGTLVNGAADDGVAGYTFVAADNGAIVLDLSNTHADDLTVTVSDLSAGISTASASISFRDNAFVITPTTCTGTNCADTPATPSHEVVAARPHGVQAALWTRDSTTGLCAVNTRYSGAFDLKAWYTADTDHPALATAPQLGAVTLPGAAPVSDNLSGITFTNGVAPLVLNTSDVGKYTLNLRDDSSGFAVGSSGTRPIDGSSGTFTTRPFALDIRNVKLADDTLNPATDASGVAFTCAGDVTDTDTTCRFEATLVAVQWEAEDDDDNDGIPDADAIGNAGTLGLNVVTARYAWDSTLAPAPAEPFEPASGVTGALNGVYGDTGFTSGSATRVNLQYNEAGNVTLQSGAVDFLNTSGVAVPGDTALVGRFRAHHFNVALSAATFTPAISSAGDAFTYLGQNFSYGSAPTIVIQARSSGDDLLENYEDDYWKLGVSLASTGNDRFQYANMVGGTSNLGAPSAAIAYGDTSNIGGSVTLSSFHAGQNFNYSRPVTPIAPFDGDVRLTVTVTDSDGATGTNNIRIGFGGETDAAAPYNTTNDQFLRWGRVYMMNAHGAELVDLQVPMTAQFYNGSTFTINGGDTGASGTTLTGPLVLADQQGTLIGDSRTCVQDTDNPGLSGVGCAAAGPGAEQFSMPPLAGDFNLWFQAPGAGFTGSFNVSAPVPAWLQFNWTGTGNSNPTARITFGIFGGSPRHIYLRERY